MALYFENLWDLFVDMSFYIVIGLIFTGLLHAYIKKETILRHIGKDTAGSVVKASVIGVPLPLCSCGVVPTAMYLGKSGASKGSVVSFLTSTPQTGVDSIIATYGMLGPLFAVYRAVAAFVSGIISGIITNAFCKNDKINYTQGKTSCGCSGDEGAEIAQSSCCSGDAHSNQASCNCSSAGEQLETEKPSHLKRLRSAFTYGFGEFLDEIAFHFVIGLLIAALISTLLPADTFSNFSNPLITMLIMVVVGIPMYICSTASIPIAISLMLKGISPGAAFVFLFAGPITNIASLLVLSKTLGKKVTAIYLIVASLCAIGFGLLLDAIINSFGSIGIYAPDIHAEHEHAMPTYMIVIAVIFGVLVLRSVIKSFMKKSSADVCCSHK